MPRSHLVRIAAFAGLLLMPYALLRIPAARAWVATFVAYLRGGGVAGGLALVGFDCAWALVAAPYWVMPAVAGYAYGFPLGVAVGLPAGTLVMCASFVVSRVALARLVTPGGPRSPRAAALRRALETDGFKIAVLLRLTPFVPQNALTYVLAPTPLGLRDFAAATLCGLLPITVFYAYVGSVVDDAAALLAGNGPDVGPAQWIGLGAGLVAGAVALLVIARVARRALARSIDPA